jgi:hypothetical protein
MRGSRFAVGSRLAKKSADGEENIGGDPRIVENQR